MLSESHYFGIDIGTATSSCYEWINNSASTTTPYNPIIPSVVLLGKTTYVGVKAIAGYNNEKKCIIYNVKRIIGREVSTISQYDKDHFPYKLDTVDGRIAIMLPESNFAKREYIFPEEVYTIIVKALLPPYFDELQGKKYAVVTVPEKFNNNQRTATANAVKCLGFSEVRLFSEPCAAAFSYFESKHVEESKTFVLFDFGGSTLDIAVIRFAQHNFKVLAVAGNPYLGGIDIDNVIIDLIKRKFGVTQKLSPMIEWKLKDVAESIKKVLSFSSQTPLDRDFIDPNFPSSVVNIMIESKEISYLIEPILTNAVDIAYQAISETPEYRRGEISMTLLTGGTSQIPDLGPIIEKKFPNFEICKLDQMSVARGACLRGILES